MISGFYRMNVLFFVLALFSISFAQKGDIEVFLIDSYVTPETPHKFVISFFTSGECSARLVIDQRYEYRISPDPQTDHRAEIDMTSLVFDSLLVPFKVFVSDADSNPSESETYEVALPEAYEMKDSDGPGLLQVCCFGGVIFGLPNPSVIYYDGEQYWGLGKEIPLLSIYSGNFTYPRHYLSLEYNYIVDAPVNNFLRAGYKNIIEIPGIEYISPGVNLFTDFEGFNGIAPEISVGLFKIYGTFTLYARYRYNLQPSGDKKFFNEISLGLFSNFFSFNL